MDDPSNADQLAEKVGIHRGKACAILLAKSLSVPVLLDYSDARKFALDLDLEVIGSVGIIIKAVRLGLISREVRKACKCYVVKYLMCTKRREKLRKVCEELHNDKARNRA